MPTTPNWLEVTQLIETYSDSALIPDRVKDWRKEKKWSRRELATQLEALSKSAERKDYALGEPAIVKIENSKRVVSLGEAIGLARVFGKTLAGLVLPDGVLQEHEGWVSILEAIEALERVQTAWDDYRDRVQRVQETIWRYPKLQDYAEQVLGAAQSQFDAGHSQDWEKDRKRRIKTAGDPVPGGADLAPYLDKQFPTLQLIALSDALADQSVDKHGWIKRDRLRKVNGAADF